MMWKKYVSVERNRNREQRRARKMSLTERLAHLWCNCGQCLDCSVAHANQCFVDSLQGI